MLELSAADGRWIGKRCIVAAPGPSLTTEIANVCGGEAPILAVNDAYKLFPHAEVLYACDEAWWKVNGFVKDFSGERWTSHSLAPKNDKTRMLHGELFHIIGGRVQQGFSNDSNFISYGNNSGFQAVNLAILFGAAEIVLVGFDMQVVDNKSHFFGNHKTPLRDTHSFVIWINEFRNASKGLAESGVRIVNATPNSALDCFPIVSIEEVLGSVGRMAAE